jgi:DNA recombination protein RmuC
MISYINTTLIVILIILFIFAVVYLKKKNDGDVYNKSDHEGFKTDIISDIQTKIDQVKTDLTTTLTNISTSAGTNKGILETKSDQILKAHQKLVDSLTGSKQFGKTGELLLENLFNNSGLVYEKQWVKNLTIKKDGKSLSVEFAIKHPTGLYLPVDAHWPKTSYEKLLELRKVETTDEIELQRLKKEKDDLFRKIVKSYEDKAEEVNKKYVDSAISAEFACVYIPSESLYHEVTTHVNEDKELWISKIQDKTKVTFMGPSTFAAYCSAILLGFNQIEGDRKAKMFVKHLEALTNSIDQLNVTTLKHENNLKKSYTDAQAVTSTAEKMKTNLQRIKEEIDNIDESKN